MCNDKFLKDSFKQLLRNQEEEKNHFMHHKKRFVEQIGKIYPPSKQGRIWRAKTSPKQGRIWRAQTSPEQGRIWRAKTSPKQGRIWRAQTSPGFEKSRVTIPDLFLPDSDESPD